MVALPAYRMTSALAAPVLNRLLQRRLRQGKEDPARLDERRGIASRPRPDGPLIWLHAASVGESQSALALVERLTADYPKVSVLVTTGTVTSAQLMETRLPDRSFHQFAPMDCPAWVDRFFAHWRPDVALWMESELWPNLLTAIRRHGVPAALINGRLSPRSFARWRRAPGFARALLGSFDLILAQSDEQAGWFRTLGPAAVECVGNLKFSALPLAADDADLSALQTAVADRAVWLAASTHDGEEAIAADVHDTLRAAHPSLLTFIAPRHPARADAIAAQLRDRGLRVARRSDGKLPTHDDDIYLADTMGELGLFYRLVPVAMIGGSFGDVGGHNLMEPAQLGCAILHGPDMKKTQAVADEMTRTGGAIRCADGTSLADTVGQLLQDSERRTALAKAAKAVAEKHTGVIDRVCDRLAPYLDELREGTS